MARRFQGFEKVPQLQKEVENAWDEVKTRVERNKDSDSLPKDLFSKLMSRLDVTSGELVYITYGERKGLCHPHANPDQDAVAYTVADKSGDSQFFLCEKAFHAKCGEKPRLAAILLHELIHTCGGKELDAEAYENRLFEGAGASPPTAYDYVRFLRDGFDGKSVKGTWVKMDPEIGLVVLIADATKIVYPFNPDLWKGMLIPTTDLRDIFKDSATTPEVRYENGGGN